MEQVLESPVSELKSREKVAISTGEKVPAKTESTRRAAKSKKSRKKDTPPISSAERLEIIQSALNFASQQGFAITAHNIDSGVAPSIGILIVGAWFCVKCNQFKPLPATAGFDCGCTNGN